MTTNTEHITRTKFNTLKKYYDETWDGNRHTLHVGLFLQDTDTLDAAYQQATNYLLHEIAKLAPIDGSSRILDVGCGTGRTLIDICTMYGCGGVGVDLSDEQIMDARSHLLQANRTRVGLGIPPIHVEFICASGSDLDRVCTEDAVFTHVISQDAILLVHDKRALFESIKRLLTPGGVFAVADFFSETAPQSVTERDHRLIYDLVNWSEPLSYETYTQVLQEIGLDIVRSERRDHDMVRTYQKLARSMESYTDREDTVYTELRDRYASIAHAASVGTMGWGFFFARKSHNKTALLAGSKEHSIGRSIAHKLHEQGWEVWLYGRGATAIDTERWHERACDITDETSVVELLKEVPHVDLALMLADAGPAHATLDALDAVGIKASVGAKMVGSALLCKHLMRANGKVDTPTKVVWCAGKPQSKPKDLILYSMINAGLASFVDAINKDYAEGLVAYYLPTPLISPSTLGDEYIRSKGSSAAFCPQHPDVVFAEVQRIVSGQVQPGMLATDTIVP